MKKLSDVFDIIVAKSGGVDDYDPGNVPLVTSAEANNGVVAYVQPEEEDRVFEGPALVISGLGFATVQLGCFLPKGNGGDSLTVLKPKTPISIEQLVSIAASYNVLHQWRFGFGRKASESRLEGLQVPFPPKTIENIWNKERDSLGALSQHLDVRLSDKASTFSPAEVKHALGKRIKTQLAEEQ